MQNAAGSRAALANEHGPRRLAVPTRMQGSRAVTAKIGVVWGGGSGRVASSYCQPDQTRPDHSSPRPKVASSRARSSSATDESCLKVRDRLAAARLAARALAADNVPDNSESLRGRLPRNVESKELRRVENPEYPPRRHLHVMRVMGSCTKFLVICVCRPAKCRHVPSPGFVPIWPRPAVFPHHRTSQRSQMRD